MSVSVSELEATPVSGRSANVVEVGAWLATAKALRVEFSYYVPKHRAAGPAVTVASGSVARRAR
jgi:hypothetical protein